jgi:hypothetical protein
LDLFDQSNLIDWFGIGQSDPDWGTRYAYFDFNGNGQIDIYDIACLSRLIQL